MTIMNKAKKTQYISLKEFIDKNTPCKNGWKCTRDDCKFLHNVKTKMCKFESNCRKKNCTYAHTKSELYIIQCKFGRTCKNPRCTFEHPTTDFWKVVEEPKEVNDIKNLNKKFFPKTIKCDKSTINTNVINYTEMKNIIKHVESATIEDIDLDIEKMVDNYKCIKDFQEITFKLI